MIMLHLDARKIDLKMYFWVKKLDNLIDYVLYADGQDLVIYPIFWFTDKYNRSFKENNTDIYLWWIIPWYIAISHG